MVHIAAVCSLFGLTAYQGKAETMCLMTNGAGRGSCVIEAAGYFCKRKATFLYVGATVCTNGGLAIDVN